MSFLIALFILVFLIIWLVVKLFFNFFINLELKREKNKQTKLNIEISRYVTAELESERNIKKSLALKRRTRSFRNHSKLIISIAISMLFVLGSYLIFKFLYKYYNYSQYLP
jgi:hypothetical protein